MNKVKICFRNAARSVYATALLVCWQLTAPVSLYGQSSIKEVENVLTQDHRQWRWTKDSVWMSERCSGNKYLLFTSSPKRVLQSFCNPKTNRRDTLCFDWKVNSDKPYNWWLTMGDSTYHLVIQETKHTIRLLLRTRESDFQRKDSTRDRIYVHFKPDQK